MTSGAQRAGSEAAWIYAPAGNEAVQAARVLAELGYEPRRVTANGTLRPEGAGPLAPAVALVFGDGQSGAAVRLVEDEELGGVPTLVAVGPDGLEDGGALHEGHELIVLPLRARELRARIARARRRVNGIDDPERIRIGTLELDLATYEVRVDGEPVALTYMEHELLRFLATHPGRAFSREALLSRVWGLDYFGGARTVDVHVRRVRAKLGGAHAGHIRTVRSVGYRFDPDPSG